LIVEKRDIVDFDHHKQSWVDDPYEIYRQLREQHPVAFSPAHGGFWLLSRYDDVKSALHDWTTFSSAASGRIAIPHTSPGDIPGIPLESDPPQHTQYRRLVARSFSRREVDKIERELARLAHQLIDAFAARGECEAVKEYATPLVARSLALFLNLPLADFARIEAWADAIFAGRTKDPARAVDANRELLAYIGEQLRLRREKPQDDIFSLLLTLEVDGRPLTDLEQLGYARLLLLAGREATIDALSNSLRYLAGNRAARQELLGKPELIETAVEEFLRHCSPIQLLGRVALRDITMHGQTIRAGESVAMLYGCANRDGRVFSDPDECQMDRSPNRHLAFGSGPHACLGAQLARLDLRVGVMGFLERIPDFSLAEGADAVRKPNGDARGHSQLKLTFGAL
jgi:cytochrome P450